MLIPSMSPFSVPLFPSVSYSLRVVAHASMAAALLLVTPTCRTAPVTSYQNPILHAEYS
jgi:hypothetical protein